MINSLNSKVTKEKYLEILNNVMQYNYNLLNYIFPFNGKFFKKIELKFVFYIL